MNCKFLETEKITEFIVLNEEQDPIIIIGFPELKRRKISIDCLIWKNNKVQIQFPETP